MKFLIALLTAATGLLHILGGVGWRGGAVRRAGDGPGPFRAADDPHLIHRCPILPGRRSTDGGGHCSGLLLDRLS